MMRSADALWAALESLAEHKLRTGLTMLGIMFGVGAVISMLSIGAGAERSALELIDRMGMRNVVVRAKDFEADELKELRKESIGVSRRDVDAIREAVSDAEAVAPRLEIEPYKVLSAGGKSESAVYGVSRRHAGLVRLPLVEGRFFDALDEREHAQVCVIGSATRRDLFGTDAAVGQHLKVDDLWLEVVGVLAPEPGEPSTVQGVAVSSRDREIYLPFTTALRKLERDPLESPLSEIVVRVRDEASPAEVAATVDGLLQRLHGGAKDYEVIVPEALLAQSRETQRLFNIVMGCIAGISLLVGGIGIMNIMLASVLERIREIGVRRAVGATRRDIGMQFLSEAIIISLAGGLAGILLGTLFSLGIERFADIDTIISGLSVAVAFGVSVTVGIAFGIMPARRAAAQDPITSLRYE
ncbi:MAG: ABC transporter permease [Gemmatimonadetes bacterium]|nr:ABC transporter permease [Gemmatimonadota bacterium]